MAEFSLRSFTTVDSQAVFGRPMGRLTGSIKWRSDCLAGVSGGSLISQTMKVSFSSPKYSMVSYGFGHTKIH